MLTHHGTWILETTASWTSSIGRSENHSTMFSVTFGWKKFWWRRGSGSEEAKPTRFRFLWRWFQDTEDTLRMEIREVGGGGAENQSRHLYAGREESQVLQWIVHTKNWSIHTSSYSWLWTHKATKWRADACGCPGPASFNLLDCMPLTLYHSIHPYLPPLSI